MSGISKVNRYSPYHTLADSVRRVNKLKKDERRKEQRQGDKKESFKDIFERSQNSNGK